MWAANWYQPNGETVSGETLIVVMPPVQGTIPELTIKSEVAVIDPIQASVADIGTVTGTVSQPVIDYSISVPTINGNVK